MLPALRSLLLGARHGGFGDFDLVVDEGVDGGAVFDELLGRGHEDYEFAEHGAADHFDEAVVD